MTLRDDLIPIVDNVRDLIVGLGLRLHQVEVVTRTWSGGQPGSGTVVAIRRLEISPRPRVRPPSPRELASEAGRYEDGDRIVDRISATLTEADLDGGNNLTVGQDVVWFVDGHPYRLTQKPEPGFLGWTVQIRRMRGGKS